MACLKLNGSAFQVNENSSPIRIAGCEIALLIGQSPMSSSLPSCLWLERKLISVSACKESMTPEVAAGVLTLVLVSGKVRGLSCLRNSLGLASTELRGMSRWKAVYVCRMLESIDNQRDKTGQSGFVNLHCDTMASATRSIKDRYKKASMSNVRYRSPCQAQTDAP